MTIRQNVPNGVPCWVDLMSTDTAKSTAFYGGLFGWVAEEPDPEFGGYTNFTKDGDRVAGLMQAQPGEGVADVWSIYLAVDDAAATVQAARDCGGDVIVDAMPVGALGTMAVVTDAGGAPCHFELHTRDYDATVAFYEKVFGWNTSPVSDTPDFRYTLLDVADGENAGIMDAGGFLPEGVPPHWSVYFAVADADAALAKVVELGGAIVQPAESTPYGRLATAADSTGALFKLRADG